MLLYLEPSRYCPTCLRLLPRRTHIWSPLLLPISPTAVCSLSLPIPATQLDSEHAIVDWHTPPCFIVTINTRDWSIGLFNWSIPYLIDHSHVLRLLLFNWLISMGFHNKVQGCIVAADGMCPALDQPPGILLLYFTLFTSFLLYSSTIIVSINRNCLSDYL
jgi:hypothetical protein